eukprot:UN22129
MCFIIAPFILIIYSMKETVKITELDKLSRENTTLSDTIRLTFNNMNWKAGVATMSCMLVEWNFNTIDPITEKHNERTLFGDSPNLSLYTGLLMGTAAGVYR